MQASLAWGDIRALNGSQPDGFEELCAQLARAETPIGGDYVRKGNPDAGVECFAVLPNGDEWGWQAKFFMSALRTAQWKQLDDSVKSALKNHPALTRYYVCVPRDRSDRRSGGSTTEMQRWDQHVAKWSRWASDRDMAVEFVWWGSSELIARLSKDEHAGRLLFWFQDRTVFSQQWLRNRLDEALKAAGPRYTPQVHIDVPIARQLALFGRTSLASNSIGEFRKRSRRAFQVLAASPEELGRDSDDFGLTTLAEAGRAIRERFSKVESTPDGIWDISDIVDSVDRAIDDVSRASDTLAGLARERAHDAQPPHAPPAYQPNQFETWLRRLGTFTHDMTAMRSELNETARLVNSHLMIVTGAAGTGKTHLLCDTARHRIEEGLPTVILLGQRFTTRDDPWAQALQHVDMGSSSAEQFLGALEAAAQAADARALLIVDAINEGEGSAIWPEHLAAFLERVERSPWISVVMSVRSSYVDLVVSEDVRTAAVVVEHHGFSSNTYDAVRTYFDYYGIELASAPILHPEYDNPLFLKVLCEGLRDSGVQRLPRGSQGITRVFERYLHGLNQRIAKELDFNPADNKALEALMTIAEVFAGRDTRVAARSEIEDLVNPLVPAVGYTNSLYRALVTSGLLIEDPGWWNQARGESVSIAFDRFADHLIASHLLDAHVDADQPHVAFHAGGGLAFLMNPDDPESYVPSGLLEAMFIQVPERTGEELFSLIPALSGSRRGVSAFLHSLVWRSSDSFSDATRTVLDDLVGRLENTLGHEVIETLLTVATIPDHSFNAHYLHDVLRGYELADRDAVWSTSLHESYGMQGAVDRLLDWATIQPSNADLIEDEVIDLYSIALTWMLTTSNRFVRDRATKSLVSTLSGRLPATVRLVTRFSSVNDPYLAERVYAVAYGVSTHSYDPESVGQLATRTYDLIFSSGKPPPHILLRDYARGVIERALYLGAAIEVDETLFRPPYQSTWPRIPTESELESLTPRSRKPDSRWDGPERSKHLIVGSVMSLDFARYVIGTDHPMREWLSHSLEGAAWQSPAERMAALEATLSASAKEALADLSEAERQVPLRLMFYDPHGNVSEPTLLTRGTSGAESDERDYEQALEHVENARSRFQSSLTTVQLNEYQAIIEAREADDDNFDPSIIQRYVLWRVFDLGWTVERFGRFDLRVSRQYPGRHADKPERIGKKYQWIAYHEILAYMSDHYQYRDPYGDGPDAHHYRGPWQIWRRDIDPSATLSEPPPDPAGESAWSDTATWWAGPAYSKWDTLPDRAEWLDTREDLPDIRRILKVVHPSDGSRWVNVRAMRSWRQVELPDDDAYAMGRREVWIHATGFFVDAAVADEFVTWSLSAGWGNRRLPDAPQAHQLFLGEHGWSPAFAEALSAILDDSRLALSDGAAYPAALRAAAVEYQVRKSEFDCSVRDNYSLHAPPPALIQALELRWSGQGVDFFDGSGNLAAFDPTAHEDGPPGLLLREELLVDYLERAGLALVWIVNGEKMVGPPGSEWRWDGFLQFFGAYVHTGEHFRGDIRFQLESPKPAEE